MHLKRSSERSSRCQRQKATLSQKEPKELIIPPQQQTILPSEPRLRTNTDASVLT